jgi:tetratricopeptide (TPR) repeat protein
LQQGEPEAALEHLKKAVSLNPKFIQAYSSLASAYFMLGRLDECIAAAKKALALEPTFAVAHNNLALAYFEQGAYKEAVAHCDKAVEYGFEVNPEFLKELEPYR